MKQNKNLCLSSLFLTLSIFLIMLSAFFFLYHYDNKYTADIPIGSNGTLTFSKEDLTRPLPLIDGWELYPDSLYDPAQFRSNTLTPSQYTFIGQYPNFSFFKKGHSPFGSATYRLVLHYRDTPQNLFLEVPEIFSRYTLWADGAVIASTGSSGLVSFSISSDTELVLSVYNDTHYYSGLTYPPLIGEPSVMSRLFLIKNIFYGILCIFSFSLCLFAIVSFLTKGCQKQFVHFGLLCFFFFLQSLYYFLHSFGIYDTFTYVMEDTARMAVLYEIVALCTFECGLHAKKWYRRTVKPICIAFCAFTAVMTAFLIPSAGFLIHPYGAAIDIYRILVFFYLIGCAVYGVTRALKGSPFIFASCAVFGVSLFLNIVQNNYFEPIYTGWQTEYATLLLVILFWFLMIQHLRQLVVRNEDLTNHLQLLVARRTEELHAIVEERKTFFSNLAHDMKAPISSIHGFVNLILHRNLYVDQDLKEYLTLIGNETDELGRRVQALSAMHTFDQITKPPVLVNLNEFLDRLLLNHEPDTSAAGIHLHIHKCDSLLTVNAVPEKLSILFENLIFNAISFTPEDGTITISASKADGYAVITLTDTGLGIAPPHLTHIFERFYCARENPQEGSGLGLYIAAITMKELGGSIDAASVVGQGTTFTLRFPL